MSDVFNEEVSGGFDDGISGVFSDRVIGGFDDGSSVDPVMELVWIQ